MHEPAPRRPGATEGPGPLTRLERAVLTALVSGEGDGYGGLQAQLVGATVASRTHSGVGFVTRIVVPDVVPAVAEALVPRLRPVHATHPQFREPAEFLLQVRGGRLAVLEAYCVEGGWPADETGFRVAG